MKAENGRSADTTSGLVRRVFISEPMNVGWVIEKLMRDVAATLNELGVETTIGAPNLYSGQEVAFHSRYLYASEFAAAKVNSLFITHIDDTLKETELKSRIPFFNSFVCMSRLEADLVRALGCPAEQVIGIDLPHRSGVVKRPKVALFSARYEDGRKNESWLTEYFAQRDQNTRNSMVLCLIGHGWESFCERLAALDVSFELYRYGRGMPGEYERQKHILEDADYLIYPGFDGGALCVYDGMAAGLELIVSDNSYHRDLDPSARLFRSKEQFFAYLDEVAARTLQRDAMMQQRSIGPYTRQLLEHWTSVLRGSPGAASNSPEDARAHLEAHQFYRSHYKFPGLRRIASSVYRLVLFRTRRLRT
jgi:hypothetical protein